MHWRREEYMWNEAVKNSPRLCLSVKGNETVNLEDINDIIGFDSEKRHCPVEWMVTRQNKREREKEGDRKLEIE